MDPGRASREGDAWGGKGEEDLGGGPDPVYRFCIRVNEKIA
jgi:hypothetical protein